RQLQLGDLDLSNACVTVRGLGHTDVFMGSRHDALPPVRRRYAQNGATAAQRSAFDCTARLGGRRLAPRGLIGRPENAAPFELCGHAAVLDFRLSTLDSRLSTIDFGNRLYGKPAEAR